MELVVNKKRQVSGLRLGSGFGSKSRFKKQATGGSDETDPNPNPTLTLILPI
jgi:hypothetical protein